MEDRSDVPLLLRRVEQVERILISCFSVSGALESQYLVDLVHRSIRTVLTCLIDLWPLVVLRDPDCVLLL